MGVVAATPCLSCRPCVPQRRFNRALCYSALPIVRKYLLRSPAVLASVVSLKGAAGCFCSFVSSDTSIAQSARSMLGRPGLRWQRKAGGNCHLNLFHLLLFRYQSRQPQSLISTRAPAPLLGQRSARIFLRRSSTCVPISALQ